jgi:CRISPR-associated protein Csh1
MIQEIINFVKDLENDYPEVFELNKMPSPGLHFWVELDEKGNWKNNPPVEGKDYVVYDGQEEKNELLMEAARYEELGKRLGTRMDKVLDTAKIEGSSKFQIFSCSPFIVSFKKQSLNQIPLRIDSYFKNAISICLDDSVLEEKAKAFKSTIPNVLTQVTLFEKTIKKRGGGEEKKKLLEIIKNSSFINIYLKNGSIESYSEAHRNYLIQKVFNNNDYNSDKELNDYTWGISNFINGTGAKFSKKIFLQHTTSCFHKGIASRIQIEDAIRLDTFEKILYRGILPKPLPLIIDKKEVKYDKNKVTSTEFIKLFDAENKRRTFPQILKSLFDENPQRVLANYYLLYIVGTTVYDFDFVSKFEYSLSDVFIYNLFNIRDKNKELSSSVKLKNIFDFERKIAGEIFNNSLIKLGDESIKYYYFDEINPKYVIGAEEMASLILRYRRAFYDFIYKSQKQAITTSMFDSLMLSSILLDVKQDEEFNKDQQIKRKLNIWLSLSQFFINHNSINMATQFQELMAKMDKIANDDNYQLDQNLQDFLFASGQIIYFLLWHNKADKPSHAMLESFLQKVTVEQLQSSITNAVNTYKHEIDFGKGRFERLCAQVLAFSSKENIKNHQRYMLAGYFAPAVILKKKEE